eukprot:6006719-Pyramimonas_sp.AAC.1
MAAQSEVMVLVRRHIRIRTKYVPWPSIMVQADAAGGFALNAPRPGRRISQNRRRGEHDPWAYLFPSACGR